MITSRLRDVKWRAQGDTANDELSWGYGLDHCTLWPLLSKEASQLDDWEKSYGFVLVKVTASSAVFFSLMFCFFPEKDMMQRLTEISRAPKT